MTPHEKIKKMNLLPENPTQFDYLHAIRAVAARHGDFRVIEILADAGMNQSQKTDTMNEHTEPPQCIDIKLRKESA